MLLSYVTVGKWESGGEKGYKADGHPGGKEFCRRVQREPRGLTWDTLGSGPGSWYPFVGKKLSQGEGLA